MIIIHDAFAVLAIIFLPQHSTLPPHSHVFHPISTTHFHTCGILLISISPPCSSFFIIYYSYSLLFLSTLLFTFLGLLPIIQSSMYSVNMFWILGRFCSSVSLSLQYTQWCLYVAKSDQSHSAHQRWILVWANSESKAEAKMPIIRKKTNKQEKPGIPRKVSEGICERMCEKE